MLFFSLISLLNLTKSACSLRILLTLKPITIGASFWINLYRFNSKSLCSYRLDFLYLMAGFALSKPLFCLFPNLLLTLAGSFSLRWGGSFLLIRADLGLWWSSSAVVWVTLATALSILFFTISTKLSWVSKAIAFSTGSSNFALG